MNISNWFEIPVSDIGRATKFYEQSLGVKLEKMESEDSKMAMFPMEENKPGAAGTLVQGKHCKPSQDGTLVYLSVDSIENTMNNIEKAGGKTLQSKKSIGQYGYISVFQDSEGNRVALHSKH